MKKNRLLIASGLLVVLLTLTVWKLGQDESQQFAAAEVEADLPEVDKDEIDELEVTRPGGSTVVLAKRDDTWRVVKPVNAEADTSAVSTALDKLANLEVAGVAATKEKNHERLEVTDAKAIRVVPKHAGKPMTELLVGSYRSGKTMVRKQGAVPVAAIRGSIRWIFDKELKDWRNKEIVEVKPDEIAELKFVNGNKQYHFIKSGSDWKPAEGQPAIANYDSSKVQSIVTSVAHLRAVDFAAADVALDKAGVQDGSPVSVTLRVVPAPEPAKDAAMAKAEGPGASGDKAAKAAQDKPEPSEAPPPYEVTVRVGNETDEKNGNRYVRRADGQVVFVISKWVAERLTAEDSQFAKPPAADKPEDSKK